MFIILLFGLATSKSIKTVVELSESSPAQYITKFGVDLGTGK